MTKEAMKLALEAFKKLGDFPHAFDECTNAIKALEEALAKQEQGEPVAWALYKGTHLDSFWMDKGDAYDYKFTSEHEWKPLYTTPQRTWVGLTDEEMEEIWGEDLRVMYSGNIEATKAIEAKLKEKNT